MGESFRRARLSIWSLLILLIILSFMSAWKAVEKQASDTALVVASKRMIERANFYKQEWLLNGKAPQLIIDGLPLRF